MRSRSIAAAALVVATLLATLLATAGPVAAHVSVRPEEVARGTVAELTFSIPNERHDAATVAIALELPGGLETVEPLPNGEWAATVDGGVVRWRGGRLTGAERLELVVRVGPLSGPDRLVLPAVQTYDSGEVVRWIEEGHDGDHPAPVLALTGEEVAATPTTTVPTTTTTVPTTTTTTEGAAGAPGAEADDDGGDIPVAPLVLAGVVALLAVGAYARTRRRSR